jgi:hypothetical protein
MAGQQGNAPALLDRMAAALENRIMKRLEESVLPGIRKAADAATVTVEKFSEQRAADERARAVDAFLELHSMGEEQRLTPAQRDVERALGLAADGKAEVRKFGEAGKEVSQTAYDLWREGIKARPPLRLFGELAGTDGEGSKSKGDREERTLRDNFQKFSETWKKGGFATADAVVEAFNVERKVRPDATAEEFLTQ